MAANISKKFQCPRHWTLEQRLDHYADKSGGPDACWPWTGTVIGDGYGQLKWKGRMQLAHRLAWIEKNGPIPPDKPHVLHRCDSPPCCNPAHLWTDTHAANVADMMRKGRHRPIRGVDNGFAKLTDADVREIRAATGTLRAIATRFNVGPITVWEIRRGKRWKHLP